MTAIKIPKQIMAPDTGQIMDIATREVVDNVIKMIDEMHQYIYGDFVTFGALTIPIAVPTGAIFPYGASTAPTGYLLCDGSAVSRTTYAALFTAIGTSFGAGDGSTTFNIPDGRGRYFFGKAAAGTGSTLGGTFGDIDHTHTTPTHMHLMDYTSLANTVLSGTICSLDSDGAYLQTSSVGATTVRALLNRTETSGSGTSGTANPPSFVGTYIIKT